MALHPELEIFITQDGSPTLIFRQGEKMHHSGGALTESLYIYHYGLQKALDEGFAPRVISLGLGLGYNELISLAEARRRGFAIKIWSFEAMDFLREQFRRWAQNDRPEPAYADMLENIAGRIEASVGVTNLKGSLCDALHNGQLELRGAYPADTAGVAEAGAVFYDAFSNKTSPELWLEQDLRNNLMPLINTRCLLCTYARTGSLKRALKDLGFQLVDRPGFQGKRESTLALRYEATS